MYELSEVGKVLINLREKNKITLRSQAAALNIAASYLVDIQYGNRDLSYTVFKKIISVYKDELSDEQITSLGVALNSPDVYERFSEVTGLKGLESINSFIYIVTGEKI